MFIFFRNSAMCGQEVLTLSEKENTNSCTFKRLLFSLLFFTQKKKIKTLALKHITSAWIKSRKEEITTGKTSISLKLIC